MKRLSHIEIVGLFATSDQATAALETLHPDLVIVDHDDAAVNRREFLARFIEGETPMQVMLVSLQETGRIVVYDRRTLAPTQAEDWLAMVQEGVTHSSNVTRHPSFLFQGGNMSWIKGLIFGVVGFLIGAGAVMLLGAQPLTSEVTIAVGYVFFLIGWLLGAGIWDHVVRGWLGLENKPTPTQASHGVWRYFMFCTDHKVIGVQYLVTFLALFLLAGLLAMLMRIHLLSPNQGFLGPENYNTVMSFHGIAMIAVAVAAVIGGLGNYFVPLLIGAEDVAFPRINALSYWFVPPVAILLVIGAFLPGGYQSGWRVYPPWAEQTGLGMLLFLMAFLTFGVSSILGGLNFVVTIIRLRAPGMTWGRLPIFVWSMFAAAILALFFTQFVAAALLMQILDRVTGMVFFKPAGGTAVLYQHVFWAYSHPAVYVMIVPGFGLMLEILTHFARKPLFAYRWAVGAFMGIVGLSGIVWVHHMFTSGLPDFINAGFMATTELISIPTGVVFLAALGTLWQARMRLTTPMLFALGFIFNFAIGGLTGIFNADVPTDLHLHNTYWIVGHFHYTIFGGEIFALLAGIYYWFPKITGRMYNETLGKVHFWITFIAFNMVYMPMMFSGLYGMNRHVAEYPPELVGLNTFVSIWSFVLGAGFLIFVYNLVASLVRGPKAVANPWQLRTLEWQTTSPPPEHNFAHVPHVLAHPYDYGVQGAPAHAMIAPGAAPAPASE